MLDDCFEANSVTSVLCSIYSPKFMALISVRQHEMKCYMNNLSNVESFRLSESTRSVYSLCSGFQASGNSFINDDSQTSEAIIYFN